MHPTDSVRITTLLSLLMLCGCVHAPRTGPTTNLSGFTEFVPDTALRFDMVAINSVPEDIGSPFWIAKTEATWDLYDVFVFRLDEQESAPIPGAAAVSRPSKPYIAMDRNFGHAGYPAISVSLHGAQQFCAWLSAKTGRQYRLPTVAEWTWICATSGIDASNADDHAWHHGNANYATHAVASKVVDAHGVHDLWGNASEWCTTSAGEGITLGGTYKDRLDTIGCNRAITPSSAWNASDPQFPKSVWWLADAGFVGFRVICVPGVSTGEVHDTSK